MEKLRLNSIKEGHANLSLIAVQILSFVLFCLRRIYYHIYSYNDWPALYYCGTPRPLFSCGIHLANFVSTFVFLSTLSAPAFLQSVAVHV